MAAAAVVFFASVSRLAGQERADDDIVRTLVFEGREWIPRESLLEASGVQVGGRWNESIAERALQGLLAMEFVAYARPAKATRSEAGKVDVVFSIEEYAALQSVDISGHQRVETEKLRAAFSLKTGRPLRQVDVDTDVRRLIDVCRDAGYLLARVTPVVTRPVPGRARLVFEIHEGPRVGISEVHIVGNEEFDEPEIITATGLRPRRLFGVLEVGEFHPRDVDLAIDGILALYRSKGFLDARVDLENVELDRRLRDVAITFRVDEGPRFRLGGVRIDGNKIFGDAILLPELDLEVGGTFSRDALVKASRDLLELYQKRSDRVPGITARLEHALEGEDVTAVFDVDERQHLFVGKVTVNGNWRTLDRVILARSEALPGNPLTLFALEDTAANIRRLGFFDDVRVETLPTEDPSIRDVRIEVDEAEEIGRWEVGGGASSGEGGVGYLRIEHPNVNIFKLPTDWSDWSDAFVGGGQSVAAEIVPGNIESQFRASFIEPYLFSTRRALKLQTSGFLFDRGPYDEERLINEIEVRQWFGWEDRLSAAAEYRLEHIRIDDLDTDAPAVVVRDQGSEFLSYPRLSMRYSDLRNNVYSGPTGRRVELIGDIASDWTGSDSDFARAELKAHWYESFLERDPDLRHSLHLGLNAGWIDGLGSDRVPFFENWFVGGPKSFRGFEYRSLGPSQAREPIGGAGMLRGTIEYSAPLFLREVRLVGIFDWGLVEEDFGDFTTGRIRTAGGGGIQLRIPLFDQIVPVNLYFVQSLSSERGDKTQLFSFTFGYGL